MTVAARPLLLNPNYLAMVRGVRELHRLTAAGLDDSPEADAIRDATDAPWAALSEAEKKRVGGLSEDLFYIADAPPISMPLTAHFKERLDVVAEARRNGEWDRALELLRGHQAKADSALINFLRGSIWLEAGDPATAALFLARAAELQADNPLYHSAYRDARNQTVPADALVQA